jgi:DNA polymerase III epsilon subunit-like protein
MIITSVPVVERQELDDAPPLLRETSFAVIDVETTGFSPLRGDRIVEIAVMRLSAGRTTQYDDPRQPAPRRGTHPYPRPHG